MDLECRRCHKPITADNINIQQMIAKCGACGALFTFGTADASSISHAASRTKAAVPRPSCWQVQREGNTLVLTRKWFRPISLFLLIFALIWNSILVVWYSGVCSIIEETGFSTVTLFYLIIPVIHVAIGIGLTYVALAGLCNRTIITVDRSAMTIRHRPLPWRHSGVIMAHEIEQLYCKERIRSSKGNVWHTYTVSVLLRNGRERKIMSGIESPEEALFLESEVEKFLGITDKPVVGEFKG